MNDILFKSDDENKMFSYRVAGIIILNGKVLMHRNLSDSGYAFPGGHVMFGETTAQALKRELKEELGIDTSVKELKWIGEVFFPNKSSRCHQICLYYLVDEIETDEFISKKIPLEGSFKGVEFFQNISFDIIFSWIPLEEIGGTDIYPDAAKGFLKEIFQNNEIKHFVDRH